MTDIHTIAKEIVAQAELDLAHTGSLKEEGIAARLEPVFAELAQLRAKVEALEKHAETLIEQGEFLAIERMNRYSELEQQLQNESSRLVQTQSSLLTAQEQVRELRRFAARLARALDASERLDDDHGLLTEYYATLAKTGGQS